ncbi:MAG: hypothetical protein OK442_05080 [Thaumarchaeota archaeon]|nr:hypothetical protein [Nitrososphaerota archaeon]
MKVVESIRGAMDAFDAFYDSTLRQETDDAKRKAISTIVLSKGEWGTAKGLELLATRLTDLVVSSTEETRALTGPEVGQLILGLLGTDPQTVESTMRRRILLDRLERLVGEAADGANLFPAKKTEEWGSHDLVYTREIAGWDLTLGYFPEYFRPRVIYGQVGVSPQVNKSVAMSARYHLAKHHLVAKNGDDDPTLLKFIKSKELDKLARIYGISYELPPLGNSTRGASHSAMGGYSMMVASLENDLRDSPYSAEKLLSQVSAVNVYHEDEAFSVHVIADFPRGKPDIGQNLTFVFGADFFKLSHQEWQNFKKIPPLAIAALEPLMD